MKFKAQILAFFVRNFERNLAKFKLNLSIFMQNFYEKRVRK